MFERILFRRSDLSRHRNGPYAKERERYLTLLMEEGRTLPTLRQNCKSALPYGRTTSAQSPISHAYPN